MSGMGYTIPGYPAGVDGKGNWIALYSGAYIYPLDPDPEHISITDIAHSLANQCRFTGHTREFYSTAQHSVLCSYVVDDPNYKLWALLHDAGEAYLSDIAKPVKIHEDFAFYKRVENNLMLAVCKAFDLEPDEPECVKRADKLMLWTEMRDLMPNDPPEDAATLDIEIEPWLPEKAEASFIARYDALTSPRIP